MTVGKKNLGSDITIGTQSEAVTQSAEFALRQRCVQVQASNFGHAGRRQTRHCELRSLTSDLNT